MNNCVNCLPISKGHSQKVVTQHPFHIWQGLWSSQLPPAEYRTTSTETLVADSRVWSKTFLCDDKYTRLSSVFKTKAQGHVCWLHVLVIKNHWQLNRANIKMYPTKKCILTYAHTNLTCEFWFSTLKGCRSRFRHSKRISAGTCIVYTIKYEIWVNLFEEPLHIIWKLSSPYLQSIAMYRE